MLLLFIDYIQHFSFNTVAAYNVFRYFRSELVAKATG